MAPRKNRVPIMLSDDELAAIDDYRFRNRIGTRSGAIRQLCAIALDDAELKDAVDAEIEKDPAFAVHGGIV